MNSIHAKQQLDALERLRKALASGGHVGAGLSIRLTIGAESENSRSIVFSVSEDTNLVLATLRESLVKTLDMSRRLAKSELRSIEEIMVDIDQAIGEQK